MNKCSCCEVEQTEDQNWALYIDWKRIDGGEWWICSPCFKAMMLKLIGLVKEKPE